MVSHLGNEGPHHESVEHLQVAPRFPPVQLAHKLPEAAHRTPHMPSANRERQVDVHTALTVQIEGTCHMLLGLSHGHAWHPLTFYVAAFMRNIRLLRLS